MTQRSAQDPDPPPSAQASAGADARAPRRLTPHEPRADAVDDDDDDDASRTLYERGARWWTRLRRLLRRRPSEAGVRPHPILLVELYPPTLRLIHRDLLAWERRLWRWQRRAADAPGDDTPARDFERASRRLLRLARVHLLQLQRLRHLACAEPPDEAAHAWRERWERDGRQATADLRERVDWLQRHAPDRGISPDELRARCVRLERHARALTRTMRGLADVIARSGEALDTLLEPSTPQKPPAPDAPR